MNSEMISALEEHRVLMARRHFFNRCGVSLGTAALAALLREDGFAAEARRRTGNQQSAVCRVCRISRRRRSV